MFDIDIKSHAILIHQNIKTNNVDVTSHDVKKVKNGFTLGASRVMNESEICALSDTLNGRECTSVNLIPDNLLHISPEAIVWTAESKTTDLVFKIDGEVQTVSCTVPRHVLAYVKGEFFAFAIKGSKRPTSETKLFYTPTGNTYQSGEVCTGNVHLKLKYDLDYIEVLEKFFYESACTSNHQQCFTGANEYSDLIEAWKLLQGEPLSKVNKKLVRTPLTLGDFIKTINMARL